MGNRRAKYLPDTLAAKYQEAVDDPELLALSDDLALIEIRISQLLAKLDSADPKEKWADFRFTISSLSKALIDEDFARAVTLAALLEKNADEKLSEYRVWEELTDLIERRRRVTESESNRLVRMQQMITAEEAVKLIDRILDSVRRLVKDPSVYAAIAFEFAVATGAASIGDSERGSAEVQPDEQGRVDQGKLLGSGTQGSDPTR